MSMFTSNFALNFVTYPIQALVKSCKILPVMVAGLIRGTYSYPPVKYFCALLVTIGLVVFNFGSSKKNSDDFSVGIFGGILLCVSLVFDGLLNT